MALSPWLSDQVIFDIFDIMLVGERKTSNFFGQLLNNQTIIANYGK
ncbi:MAG: hypothetical protein QNJ55_36350 [Xenococcus sp. MO_188.B8]|nr:hypothetical protein [Xenococcus sp. MO_188.B8]